MKIEFADVFKIQELDVECKMTLNPGHMTCLLGENGVGKSTLLQYLKINQDDIFREKKPIFVDQFPLIPINKINLKDLEKNLSYLLKTDEQQSIINELRDYIRSFEETPINELSGGQNQLIKILIALYLSGDIYLFDEPFQYLDNLNIERFKNILKELKKQGKSILIIEHRQELLKEMIDDFYYMEKTDKVRVTLGN